MPRFARVVFSPPAKWLCPHNARVPLATRSKYAPAGSRHVYDPHDTLPRQAEGAALHRDYWMLGMNKAY